MQIDLPIAELSLDAFPFPGTGGRTVTGAGSCGRAATHESRKHGRRAAAALGVVLVILAIGVLAPAARAQELVADLSRHLVAITTGFAGTEVLLFGTTEGEGNVVVVVRGPDRQAVVRRKVRVAGIWVNRQRFVFNNAPSFYAVASSRPLKDILSDEVMARHRIGFAHLGLKPPNKADEAKWKTFRAALIRNREREGLYGEFPGKVTFLGRRLFRTTIYFPSNVPTGTYLVEAFLVRHGRVVSAQTTPLLISKVGLGAEIFEFAHQDAMLYGIMAVLMALSLGWLIGVVFRKA